MNKIDIQLCKINLYLRKYLPKYRVSLWHYTAGTTHIKIEDCETFFICAYFLPRNLFFPVFQSQKVDKNLELKIKEFAEYQGTAQSLWNEK